MVCAGMYSIEWRLVDACSDCINDVFTAYKISNVRCRPKIILAYSMIRGHLLHVSLYRFTCGVVGPKNSNFLLNFGI